ncbi:hypothetical protein [Reyranella sp.]|uniref:hypothetical protein n=1 Tax=Reyranella sp. TaxID=1929291 RepID=UPI0011FFB292|nr:hypothetical protein [Reyranella sp.]TAJ89436.1 MAG: hypothetical protein EPO50_03455 [Reyranella sp.]
MWLFKKAMPLPTAALEIHRAAAPLLARLRNRLTPFGLHRRDGFELEAVALVHAAVVSGVEGSQFAVADRDRLQDAFTLVYADRVLRLRLTHDLFELHPPLAALQAKEAQRELRLTSHDRLDLANLQQFLVARVASYRQGNLEDQIRTFLTFLEADREPPFELMFSMAVFLTDTQQAAREAADSLQERVFLV